MCEKQSAFRDGLNTLTKNIRLKGYIYADRQKDSIYRNLCELMLAYYYLID